MARFLQYNFPAGNPTDICAVQNMLGAGKLILNGNLANGVTSAVSFINNGYSRQVSISSVNNNSARQFTVTGTQNGVVITENIAGPNNNTVYGNLIYDVITSIVSDGAAAAVSFGSGWKGFFPLINIDLEREVINYTLTLSTDGNNSTTALFGSLQKLYNNGFTHSNNIGFPYVFTLRAATASSQYVYYYPNLAGTVLNPNPLFSSLLVQLGANAGTIGVPVQLNFMQT